MPRRRPSRRQQLSSPPPPPPMPPGQGHRVDPPQRPPPPPSPLPPSPPPPPGQGHRGDPPQRPPFPTHRPERFPPPFHLQVRRRRPPAPNPGPSPGLDIHDMLGKAVVDRELDESQRSDQEDQHAPQLTPSQNLGPTQQQYIHDLLDKAVADGKLNECQRRRILLDSLNPEVSLEELRITLASSLSLQQPTLCVPNILESELKTSPPLPSCISSLTPTGLLIKYFIRVDKDHFFHTYPDVGGPFQSLEEAQHAIDTKHVVGRKNLCMVGLSSEEMSVRYALHWPHDGLRKNSAEAFAAMAARDPVHEVVKALLDKNNEETVCLGDPSYELKDIVSYKPCFDWEGHDYRSYSHLNLTLKTKGASDSACADSKLFFAEVTCFIDEHEDEQYMLTCFCEVEANDNGKCNVCGEEMKHPTEGEYKVGRQMPRIRCCSEAGADADEFFDELFTVRDEAWLKAEEARVRRMFKESHEAFKRDTKLFKESREAIKRDTKLFKESREAIKRDTKYVVPARR